MNQARISLAHTEQAVQALLGSENRLAAEQTEDWLAEEKSRLASIRSELTNGLSFYIIKITATT